MDYKILDKSWEKQIRRLWKASFEDSDAYMNFYFENIYPDNLVFGATDDGRLVSMIHLNPYQVMFNGCRRRLHYIVGVATDEEYRKRGIMKKLMSECLIYLKSEGEPFTYLMPEKEIYYAGMGFHRYEDSEVIPIGQYEEMLKGIPDKTMCGINIKKAGAEKEQDLARFNQALSEKYDLFAVRDRKYLRLLDGQCKSEGGGAFILYQNHDIQAVFGTMKHNGCDELIQYLSLHPSLAEIILIYQCLKLKIPDKIEIFGTLFTQGGEVLKFSKGKGIMYKILDKGIQNDILCGKMLMISEIV